MARKTPHSKSAKSVREVVRDESRAVYRGAILEAAERVIGRLGFTGAKMADIAAEAGVAAGTLYNYFKNKDEVFESILIRGHEHLFGLLQLSMAIVHPLDRIRAFMTTTYQYLEGHGALFSIYLHRGGLYEWSQQKLKESPHRELYERYDQLMEQTLAEGVNQGLIRKDIAVDELAAMFAGISDAQIFAWIRRGYASDLSAKIDILLDMFLKGAQAA